MFESEKIIQREEKIPGSLSSYVANPINEYITNSKYCSKHKNEELANLVIDNLRPKKINGNIYENLLLGDSIDSLMPQGHGLFFFFYMTRFFIFLFLVLSAIATIPLIFNIYGDGLAEFVHIPFWVKTTAPNGPNFYSASNGTQTQVEILSIDNLNNRFTNITISNITAFIPYYYFTQGYVNEVNVSASLLLYTGKIVDLKLENKCIISNIRFDEFNCTNSEIENSNILRLSSNKDSIKSSIVTNSTSHLSIVSNASLTSSFLYNSTYNFSSILNGNFSNSYALLSDLKNVSINNAEVRTSHIIDTVMDKVIVLSAFVDCCNFGASVLYSSKFINSSVYSSNVDTCILLDSFSDLTYASRSIFISSTISNCTLFSCNLTNSSAFKTSASFSNVTFSKLYDSVIYKSNISQSTLENKVYMINTKAFDSRFINSMIQFSNIAGSFLNNSIVINSSVVGLIVDGLVIINNITIQGNISNIISPDSGFGHIFSTNTSTSSSSKDTLTLKTTMNLNITNSNNTINLTINQYQNLKIKIAQFISEIDVEGSHTYFFVNLICDCLFCLVFVFALFFLKYLFLKKALEVDAHMMSVSKFTVKLTNFPRNIIAKSEIKTFIEKLTDDHIITINFAYKFEGVLNCLLKRVNLEKKLTDFNNNHKNDVDFKQKTNFYKNSIEKINKQLFQTIKTHQINFNNLSDNFCPFDAYVIFNDSAAPKKLLKIFNYAKKEKNRDLFTIGGKKIQISLPSDVYNIDFENVGGSKKSKVLKFFMFIMIMIGLIALTTYASDIVENRITSLMNKYDCDDDLDYPRPSLIDQTDKYYCYCKSHLGYYLQNQYRMDCNNYLYMDKSNLLAPFVVVIIITFSNIMIDFLVEKMFNWACFVDQSSKISWKIIVLFFFEYANIIFVIFVNNGEYISYTSVEKAQSSVKSKLSLISSSWYINSGTKIIMLNFFSIFIPHILNFTLVKLKTMYNRYKSKKVSLQNTYLELRTPNHFTLDQNYVYILTTIATSVTFYAAMPLLILFTFFSLLFSFWVQKYIFLKECRNSNLYTEKIVIHILALLPFILIVHIFFSVSVYGDYFLYFDKNSSNVIFNILTSDTSMTFFEDLQARVSKSRYFVICGGSLIILYFFECLISILYGQTLLNNLKIEKQYRNLYLDDYPKLLYNSALNYDFRLLPKYSCLINAMRGSAIESMIAIKNENNFGNQINWDNMTEEELRFMINEFLKYCGMNKRDDQDHVLITSL